MDIPAIWQEIQIRDLEGVLLIVGAQDAGKTIFSRYLAQRLNDAGRKTAYIDGDPGQSSLGPPSTMSMFYETPLTWAFNTVASPAGGIMRRYFVGSISPRGHMLFLLVGAARLVAAAKQAGAEVIVYDTTGLVDPAAGGLALKNAKIELLRPQTLFAIQSEKELQPLLVPLHKSRRTRVIELAPSPAVRRRDPDERRRYRQNLFSQYFAGSHPVIYDWGHQAVFPTPNLSLQRLAALEDEDGFMRALAVVQEIDRDKKEAVLLTPLQSLEEVTALRLGDLSISLPTFRHERI